MNNPMQSPQYAGHSNVFIGWDWLAWGEQICESEKSVPSHGHDNKSQAAALPLTLNKQCRCRSCIPVRCQDFRVFRFGADAAGD